LIRVERVINAIAVEVKSREALIWYSISIKIKGLHVVTYSIPIRIDVSIVGETIAIDVRHPRRGGRAVFIVRVVDPIAVSIYAARWAEADQILRLDSIDDSIPITVRILEIGYLITI
jgi:hypothetical protein